MRSNVSFWKTLHDQNYFENHPCYRGLVDMGDSECGVIEWFLPLKSDLKMVVIGCGYGREIAHIAPRVNHVWGIDVNERILDKAVTYLGQKGVVNFTPVMADAYAGVVPSGIDLVFSIVVMQHLTRDLVKNYFQVLGAKLAPQGKMVIQFLEELAGDLSGDAELRAYEPSVSWSISQIVGLARTAGLELEQCRSYLATPEALWHWVLIGKK